MPIKSLIDPQYNKAEFSIGRDVELVFCSATCLLRQVDERARVVRTGQTAATALTVILGEDRLLVPLAGAPRPHEHILGAQHGRASARANWEKLLGCGHPSLMPVHGVCDCMAQTQILDGEPFEDAATTPAWKKVRSIAGKAAGPGLDSRTATFEQWRAWMGALAHGLGELEKMGLAHGDPYPFNAVRNTGSAAWVDFGHVSDDPEQCHKDAWAFVLFTVLHTLNKAPMFSPELLRQLASAMTQADRAGRFDRLAAVFASAYDDLQPLDDPRTPGLIFIEAVTERPNDDQLANPAVQQLLLKACAQYFSAFLHHLQRANQFSTALHVELQRHLFQEEEMLRLTVPRTEHQQQLDAQTASHRELVSQKDEQISKLNQALAQRDTQIVQLDTQIAQRDTQITQQSRHSTQLKGELDSLFKRHEQILGSRSWRVTRPLRAAARFAKYGFNYPGGRQALYRFAAQIGRKFPFPLGLKARVRAALLPKQPAFHTPAPHADQASREDIASLMGGTGQGPLVAMRAGHCGLKEGLVSVILPVYNQADLLAESIDSVLNQTYGNFELVIINDGSTDGVESVLERYLGHPKVRCYTQANQRLPKALSNGFDFAGGEFWTWTSADNIMEPTMLEELVSRLQGDPGLGLVYADYYAIDDRGALLMDSAWRAHNRPDPSSGAIRLPRSAGALNTVQDNFIGPCFMYRGWIGKCLGDYDTQLGVEDYDYWMRINAFFPVRHIGSDSLLYRYRVHDNTLSAQAKEHKILDKVQLLMEYEKERGSSYQSPLASVADDAGARWLQGQGVVSGDIVSFGGSVPGNSVIVLGSDTAEKHISNLLRSRQPVAVILTKADTRYHKLRELFNCGHCVVLAGDEISAKRVRLAGTCPLFDLQSGSALPALRAFAKNLLFIRATRRPDEMRREAPRLIRSAHAKHVLLQVDSFTQGGMENVVIDLALSLQGCGYRVTIANLGKSGDAAAKATERGLTVVSFASQPAEDEYLSWLRENQVDVVNAHYSTHGAAACHQAGIPFVQTIHNSYVWLDPEHIARYREADAHTIQYLCVSATAARYADVALGLDVGKMRVVPNGIDPGTISAEHFPEHRADLRGIWGIGEGTPVFINVASIMATKAQLPLVKAFARVVEKCPDARLVLLGTSMEASYHNAVRNAVKDLQLQKNVVFAGYDRNVARYYHAADVFVLPSYWEGWSLSLGEAMANGLACVITDVGSAYEFEGRENVEIIAPPFGDITALNYQNLGHFVYGEDKDFEERLAASMIKAAALARAPVNRALAQTLDRGIAYRMYAEFFSTLKS